MQWRTRRVFNRNDQIESHASACDDAEVEAALDGARTESDTEAAFKEAAAGTNLVPLFQRILSDHLTPVLAYRCLVAEDDRAAPSFLFESVVNGDQQVGDGL